MNSQEIEEIRNRWTDGRFIQTSGAIDDMQRMFAIVEELQKANHELKVSYVVQDPWSHVDQLEELQSLVYAQKMVIRDLNRDQGNSYATVEKLREELKEAQASIAIYEKALHIAQDSAPVMETPATAIDSKGNFRGRCPRCFSEDKIEFFYY